MAANGWKAGALLNTLKCTGQPPQQRVSSPKCPLCQAEEPWFGQGSQGAPAQTSQEEARCRSRAPRQGVPAIRVILTIGRVKGCVLLALMRHRGAVSSPRPPKGQDRARPGAHLSSLLEQSPRRSPESSLKGSTCQSLRGSFPPSPSIFYSSGLGNYFPSLGLTARSTVPDTMGHGGSRSHPSRAAKSPCSTGPAQGVLSTYSKYKKQKQNCL